MKYLFTALLFICCVLHLQAQLDEVSPANYKQRTNIPSIYIETFDKASITSKTVYKYCRIVRVDSTSVEVFDSVKIRGRGNASWGFPKKPYRIKLAQSSRFLGKNFAKAKNWTLLSNGGEKLMLRNGLNSFVGKVAGLTFNPACKFVDLNINGVYHGTYQVSDQIDIRPLRVDIVNQEEVTSMVNVSGGYLMEVDGYTDAGETYFQTPSGSNIRVHEPDADIITARQLSYIKGFMNTFENTLFSDRFMNTESGYRKYIDSTSLVAWYLSSEIGSNFDLFHSTYFYKERNDNHLFLGPLWDNDLGYNHDSRYGDETETLMSNVAYGSNKWFKRIEEDPWFRIACANHYNRMYENGLDSLMLNYIDSVVNEIHASVDENFKVWSITQIVHHDMVVFNTYDEYVEDIKKYIVAHNAFLYKTFNRLKPSTFTLNDDYYYQFYNKRYNVGVVGVLDSTASTTEACLKMNANGQVAQQWELKANGDYYTVLNARNGLALCDNNSKGANKTLLTLETYQEGNSTQLWKIIPQTMGYFNLQNAYTQNILSNFNSRPVDGNNLYGYTSSSLDSTNESRLWGIRMVSKATDDPTRIEQLQQARMDYVLTFNPESGILHFVAPNLANLVFKASVYDLNGTLQGSFRADEDFDMTNLPAATYIVNWQFGGKSHSTKFIKSN